MKDYLIKILLFRIIMRLIGFYGFVVLKNWIELLQLFQSAPALAEQLFAEGSVQGKKVFDPRYNFLKLGIGLIEK